MTEENADAKPRVTVELDAGPFTMRFGYVPIGRASYVDVPSMVGGFPTLAEAEMVGAQMLAVGNWKSFHVEKRFTSDG